MQAGATLEEIVEAGATYGRCITSQAERSCSPDTPMTKGRLRSPLDPIDQPYADWMHTIVIADGSRAGLGDWHLHLHRNIMAKRHARLIDTPRCDLEQPSPSQESRIMLS